MASEPEFEILKAIVLTITVPVVNGLPLFKRTAKMASHDEAVLKDSRDHDVARSRLDAPLVAFQGCALIEAPYAILLSLASTNFQALRGTGEVVALTTVNALPTDALNEVAANNALPLFGLIPPLGFFRSKPGDTPPMTFRGAGVLVLRSGARTVWDLLSALLAGNRLKRRPARLPVVLVAEAFGDDGFAAP